MSETLFFAFAGGLDERVAIDRRLRAVARRFLAPRDLSRALGFAASLPLSGPLLVYGAGTHTRALLGVLRQRADTDVMGVVDQRAPDLRGFEGLPVVEPASAAARSERVLAAHPLHEPDMIDTLLRSGTARRRIIPLYGHPAYAAAALADERARLLRELPRRAEIVLVGSRSWSLIDDDDLAGVLSPASTVHLHFDATEPFSDGGVFRSHAMNGSLVLLKDALRRLAPRVVFLRTRIETNFLALFIRRWFPEIRLIHEVFDFSALFNDAALRGWGFSPEVVALSRTAERFTMRNSDLVISKRRGPRWEAATKEIAVPYRHYFAGMPSGFPPMPASGGDGTPIRLLYAGILPIPERIGVFRSDYNFLGLLEELTRGGGISVALYNRLHRDESMDDVFAAYSRRYRGGAMEYHRCVPLRDLLRLAQGFHFAWLFRLPNDDDNPDALMTIPNRVTSSIAAGLPLIVDDGWEALSGLVADFKAGLVLSRGRPDLVEDAIRRADRVALRAGARRLRDHMLKQNGSVLAEMASIMGQDRSTNILPGSPSRGVIDHDG